MQEYSIAKKEQGKLLSTPKERKKTCEEKTKQLRKK
jgi:hypothetical protein